MFKYSKKNIDSGRLVINYKSSNNFLTCKEFIINLSNPILVDSIIKSFTHLNLDFNNFMIKTPLITNRNINNEFLFSVNKTVFLAKIGDYSKFTNYMNTRKHFVSFKSLSGNILLVPHPFNGEENKENYKNYLDMAGFIKHAPKDKIQLFWKNVKTIANELLDNKREFYMQTIGHDVPYFHFRFVISKNWDVCNIRKEFLELVRTCSNIETYDEIDDIALEITISNQKIIKELEILEIIKVRILETSKIESLFSNW